jgi:hypothetical protein
MKRIGLFIAFLTVLGFLLSDSAAQDAKKDADKAEKKDEPKKDEKKTDPEKKDEKEPKKEKFVFSTKLHTKLYSKILNIKADSNREFTVETQEVDPNKVTEIQKWSAQRQQQLAQQYGQAASQKDFKARANALQTWMRDSSNYQAEMAKKNVYSTKPMEVRATETAKVRSITPPIEFDDVGNEKKWTKKELEARKDKTGLPGYAVDFDALKQGQQVELWMVKPPPMKKGDKKKKDDDDPPPMKDAKEFVLIVITNAKGK